jgi:succinate--hydroxymethylglutarate CoA-transferase
VGSPIRLDGACRGSSLPPPTLGQHTADVLRETLGLTEPQIRDLREHRVI